MKRVFISREISEVTELNVFCQQQGISLVAHSLIQFEAVPVNNVPYFDVVFFSSIRAARFFFENNISIEGKKLACIGEKTAEKIQQAFGVSFDFIGSKSAEPSAVAFDFSYWLAGRKVLFPHSDLSQKTAVSLLPAQQVVAFEMYKTQFVSQKIEPCDAYIFSSPSNVEAFLLVNELPKKNIITWGETTAKFLREKGVETIVLKGNPYFENIKKEVLKLINTSPL